MSARPPAGRMVLLAALLLVLAWLLAGLTDMQQPGVSVALVVCFAGAWLAGWIGLGRVVNRGVAA